MLLGAGALLVAAAGHVRDNIVRHPRLLRWRRRRFGAGDRLRCQLRERDTPLSIGAARTSVLPCVREGRLLRARTMQQTARQHMRSYKQNRLQLRKRRTLR